MTAAQVTSIPLEPATDGPRGVQSWSLANGGLVAEVLTYGARLHALRVPDRDGQVADVVVGPQTLDGYVADDLPYAGATIGRWANRLRGARVTIDDVEHQLEANEGVNLLHGGIEGFDRRVWQARDASDERGPAVELTLTSPDGDQGFPGTVQATATYRLLDTATLVMTHTATTDVTTIVGMTNHAYWHLGGGDASLDDHVLQVRAGRHLVVDDDLLPRGVASVLGTNLDLREPRGLADVMARGMVDHCLLLDDPSQPAAVVVHPPSGRRMVLTTDLPAMQVFLGGRLDDLAAFALEPEIAPDAPNRPDLGMAVDGLLRPGERFEHTTTVTFDTV